MDSAVMYIVFIVMVTTIILNIVFAKDHWKARESYLKKSKEYYRLLFGLRDEFWKQMGAYKAEDGKMYLDFDGIRLVIFEGKIDGWYET